MNDVVHIPDNYYPTPPALVTEMLDGIDFSEMTTFLEPSAGTGNIIKGLSEKFESSTGYSGYNRRNGLIVDCIELDPNIRSILKDTFSEEHGKEIRHQISEIEKKTDYDSKLKCRPALSGKDKERLYMLNQEQQRTNASIHIVYDDFLKFHTYKRYDAIIMNPPFDAGDLHLLHAIEMQKQGGYIVCLLNAETIRNPYTNSRQLLKNKLDEYEAEIKFKTGQFMTPETERKTDVEIAIVKMTIPQAERHSIIYDNLKKAREQKTEKAEATAITKATGTIENMIEQCDFEIELGVTLINEYRAISPYICKSLEEDSYGRNTCILTLTVGTDRNVHQSCDINEYAHLVRAKFWKAFFSNPEFTGMLTSKLRDDFMNTVDEMANYDFSMFNIEQVLQQIKSLLISGVEKAIMVIFDTLTEEHSWYPETKQNRHYYDGWATNKAHMVGRKCIIPCYGAFAQSWDRSESLDKHTCYDALSDIEKALNYLDCGETVNVDLSGVIDTCATRGQTKNIPCKYFTVTFYKKGTMHIVFTNQDVVDKLNIYASRNRNWLPPRYGKVRYDDMSAEEQTVIDGFSGKEAYEKVCNEPGRYIIETNAFGNILALNA